MSEEPKKFLSNEKLCDIIKEDANSIEQQNLEKYRNIKLANNKIISYYWVDHNYYIVPKWAASNLYIQYIKNGNIVDEKIIDKESYSLICADGYLSIDYLADVFN